MTPRPAPCRSRVSLAHRRAGARQARRHDPRGVRPLSGSGGPRRPGLGGAARCRAPCAGRQAGARQALAAHRRPGAAGLRLDGWYAYADAGRSTLRDVTAHWFFVDSASNISILGGSVGPADSIDPQIRAANTTGAAVPTNIRIEDVTFHDFTNNADPRPTSSACSSARARAWSCATAASCAAPSTRSSWARGAGRPPCTTSPSRTTHFGTVPRGITRCGWGVDGVSKIAVRRNSAMQRHAGRRRRARRDLRRQPCPAAAVGVLCRSALHRQHVVGRQVRGDRSAAGRGRAAGPRGRPRASRSA